MHKTLACWLVMNNIAIASTEQHELEFDSKDIKQIYIQSDAGNITIQAQDRDQTTKVRYFPSTPNCQQKIEKDGDTLIIKNKKNSGGCHCDYTIWLPQNTNIRSQTGSAQYDVNTMTADFNVQNGSGMIKTNSEFSNVKLQLGAGTIDMKNLKSNIKISGGSIQTRLHYLRQPTVPVDIKVGLGSGNVDLYFPYLSKVKYKPSNNVTSDFLTPLIIMILMQKSRVVLDKPQ